MYITIYMYIICIKQYLNKIDWLGKHKMAPLWHYVPSGHHRISSLEIPGRMGLSQACHSIT